jgi:hypothetical protein
MENMKCILASQRVNAKRVAVRSIAWLDLSKNNDVVTPLHVIQCPGLVRLG